MIVSAFVPVMQASRKPMSVFTPRFAATTPNYPEFHAHVYFDKATRSVADQLQKDAAKEFPKVKVGKLHDQPVGPHLKPMFALYFKEAEFSKVVQWLMENRGGLSVLVHPETGDDKKDHGERPLWLGEPSGKLKLDFFG